jgi:hypothetical protein
VEVLTTAMSRVALSMVTINDESFENVEFFQLNQITNFWLILTPNVNIAESKKEIARKKFKEIILPTLKKDRDAFMDVESRLASSSSSPPPPDRRVLLTQDGCGPEMNALLDFIGSATMYQHFNSSSSSPSPSSSSSQPPFSILSYTDDPLIEEWLECIKFYASGTHLFQPNDVMKSHNTYKTLTSHQTDVLLKLGDESQVPAYIKPIEK